MIEMTFQKGGNVIVEPKGYNDSLCFEATSSYLHAFGGAQETRLKHDHEIVQRIQEQQERQHR